jgi:hypothetical protein
MLVQFLLYNGISIASSSVSRDHPLDNSEIHGLHLLEISSSRTIVARENRYHRSGYKSKAEEIGSGKVGRDFKSYLYGEPAEAVRSKKCTVARAYV